MGISKDHLTLVCPTLVTQWLRRFLSQHYVHNSIQTGLTYENLDNLARQGLEDSNRRTRERELPNKNVC
jgi:DNA-binding PadR family transcriptional regulator